VFANNDDALKTVESLNTAGIEIAAVVDSRADNKAAVQAALRAEAPLVTGAVTAVHGRSRVSAVEVRDREGKITTHDCDLLAVSGGWNPTVHLTCHLGGAPVWSEALSAFVPGTLPPGMTAAGAAAGQLSLGECLSRGAEAGRQAAEACGFNPALIPVPETEPESVAISPLWQVKGSHGKAFVDFQNDVTDKDVTLAEREGFRSVEHLKRYTTLGMATDQGKTSNVNALAVMASLTGRSIPATGVTRFRPPYVPVAIGALAGPHRGEDFKPVRYAPSHDWAVEQGAVFVDAGMWRRAQYFPKPGETDWLETVTREVTQTREHVGICDVSTLGKIDVQGSDAAAFLDRLYVNTMSTLAVGKTRYGLMLREDGIVFDDGTAARLGDTHFFVTTTTANAAAVLQHMEFCHQVLWPELDVQFASATDQWAQYSIAGPKARELLRRVVDPAFDISNEKFPYLAAADITAFGGVKARLFRVSFSGELAYEISLPARYGDAAIRRIMQLGKGFGLVAYGTEALGVMRIEKGHVAGNELNGQTTARDLGLGKMMSAKKDYIGRVMSGRPGLVDPARPCFVGFKPVNRAERLYSGAHFLAAGVAAVTGNDQGFMTSAAYSPINGHWVGLGFLARGPGRIGEVLRAYDPLRGGDALVEICDPVFYDPKGERLRV
jgi:sarcosine oxidase subunit alpha